MLEHFSEHSVRGQIEKSAADMRHDQAEPKSRNIRQKKIADDTAQERGGLNCANPAERGAAMQSSTYQKAAEREPFRNLVNAQSGEQRPFRRVHRSPAVAGLNSQSQTVGRAVNCQCDD